MIVGELKAMKSSFEDTHPLITKWGHVFLQNSFSKRQTFLRIFKRVWKATIMEITFLNVHLFCKMQNLMHFAFESNLVENN